MPEGDSPCATQIIGWRFACLCTPHPSHRPFPAHLQIAPPFRSQTKLPVGAQGYTSLGFCILGGVLVWLLLRGPSCPPCVRSAQPQAGLFRVPLLLPLQTWVLPETTSCVAFSHYPPKLHVQSREGMLVSLLFTRMKQRNKALNSFPGQPSPCVSLCPPSLCLIRFLGLNYSPRSLLVHSRSP